MHMKSLQQWDKKCSQLVISNLTYIIASFTYLTGTVMLQYVPCSLQSSRCWATQILSCWVGQTKTREFILKLVVLELLWRLGMNSIQTYKTITLMSLVKDCRRWIKTESFLKFIILTHNFFYVYISFSFLLSLSFNALTSNNSLHLLWPCVMQ